MIRIEFTEGAKRANGAKWACGLDLRRLVEMGSRYFSAD